MRRGVLRRGTAARASVVALLAAVLVLADPPAALQDSGDCGIEGSQPSTKTVEGKDYEARSFFDTATRSAVGGITKDDLDALAKEVDRLKKNDCYEVCVRSLVTAAGFAQALANCDCVFIVAHGSAKAPYLGLGGDKAGQMTQWPGTVNAGAVWIGACHGNEAATALNGASGTRYRSLPNKKFDAEGCALRSDMIKGLTAELQKLQDTHCQRKKKVCILAGVQEVKAK